MQPFIDHIQITVKNMEQAEPFYDKFLAIIGFDISKKVSTILNLIPQKPQGVRKGVQKYVHGLIACLRASGKVDDQRSPPDHRHGPAEHSVRGDP